MARVLFICTGNTCRSPMAEAIAIHYYGNEGKNTFFSRGLSVPYQRGAEKNAIDVMKNDYGLDITSHTAKQVTDEDIAEATLILTMTKSHYTLLTAIYPSYLDKILTLTEFAGLDSGFDSDGIPDPFGGNIEEYACCANKIDECIKKIKIY